MTPQTGTWINPKWAVKDTPAEQFEWAMRFYKSKDYKKAVDEFLKLVKYYPQASSRRGAVLRGAILRGAGGI